jgi:hypothetical protein
VIKSPASRRSIRGSSISSRTSSGSRKDVTPAGCSTPVERRPSSGRRKTPRPGRTRHSPGWLGTGEHRGARAPLRPTASAPCSKRVDTCAARVRELYAHLYSTYEDEDEAGESAHRTGSSCSGKRTDRRILGQGLEYRLCCCQAALRRARRPVSTSRHDQLQSGDGEHRLRHRRTSSTSKAIERPIHVGAGGSPARKPRGCPSFQFGVLLGRRRVKLSHQVGPVLGTPGRSDRSHGGPGRAIRGRSLQLSAASRSPRVGGRATTSRKPSVVAGRLGLPQLHVAAFPTCSAGQPHDGDLLRPDGTSTASSRRRRPSPRAKTLGRSSSTGTSSGRASYDVDALCDGTDVHIGGIVEQHRVRPVRRALAAVLGGSAWLPPRVALRLGADAESRTTPRQNRARTLAVIGLG